METRPPPRRRTMNGLSSPSPTSSPSNTYVNQYPEIDLREYPGLIELQQQITEIARKLEVSLEFRRQIGVCL